MLFDIKPIGYIESDFQVGQKQETLCTIHIFSEYIEGLEGLEGCSEVYVVFATHSPRRPNHIGISICPILELGKDYIKINNCDMIDQTPVLDIKPKRQGTYNVLV